MKNSGYLSYYQLINLFIDNFTWLEFDSKICEQEVCSLKFHNVRLCCKILNLDLPSIHYIRLFRIRLNSSFEIFKLNVYSFFVDLKKNYSSANKENKMQSRKTQFLLEKYLKFRLFRMLIGLNSRICQFMTIVFKITGSVFAKSLTRHLTSQKIVDTKKQI